MLWFPLLYPLCDCIDSYVSEDIVQVCESWSNSVCNTDSAMTNKYEDLFIF